MNLMVRISNSRRGSSTIEAALVLPILILIIAAIVSTSIRFEKDVEESSQLHIVKAAESINDDLGNPEDLTRARWLLE